MNIHRERHAVPLQPRHTRDLWASIDASSELGGMREKSGATADRARLNGLCIREASETKFRREMAY